MARDLSREVAAEVRRLILERGWSGRELSRRSGIPQPSISKKLADVHPFDLDDLEAICEVLEVTPAELVAWAERVEQLAAARDRMADSLALFAAADAQAPDQRPAVWLEGGIAVPADVADALERYRGDR